MSSPGRSREPKEVPSFDLSLSGLGRTILVEDDASIFSRLYDVEPLVLVAMPVRDGADVSGRYSHEMDPALGQADLVTEILFVLEDVGVQRVRTAFSFVELRRAYEIRGAVDLGGSILDLSGPYRQTDLMFAIARVSITASCSDECSGEVPMTEQPQHARHLSGSDGVWGSVGATST